MALGIWEVAKSSFKGQLGDQYLEFFECPALDNDVLMVKGRKRITKNSKNRNGEDIPSIDIEREFNDEYMKDSLREDMYCYKEQDVGVEI